MAVKTGFSFLLAAMIAATGVTVSVTGCNKEKDTEEDDDKKKEKDEETEEEAEETKAEESEEGEVTTYPDMTPTGGTFRLLQSFSVYQAADLASKKLTGLAPGTLVNFKFNYRNFIMVDWPCGPGTLCPGWMHVRPSSPQIKADKPIIIDAGTPVEVPDAGTPVVEVPDAGTPVVVPDAGPVVQPKFKFKIPKIKK
jgi:hypothetical protein